MESRSCTQETRKQPTALSCPHTSSDRGEEAPLTPLADSGLALDEQGEPRVMGLGLHLVHSGSRVKPQVYVWLMRSLGNANIQPSLRTMGMIFTDDS